MEFTTVDLFAGAGGLSLGFALAGGFEPVFAVEHDRAAAATFETNFAAAVYADDIENLDPATYPDADIVLGGPPCQGFSPLGRDRDPSSRAALNSLWRHYIAAVRHIRPAGFVVENVPQFLGSAQFAEFATLMAQDRFLRRYNVAHGVLDAADYGAAQHRRRAVIVAVKARNVPWPPAQTHGPQRESSGWRTVRSAIGDLPEEPTSAGPAINEDGTQDLHFGRNPTDVSLQRYRVIPPGGNRFDLARLRPDITPACWLNKPSGTTDVMGRMWWDRPAPTIRTEFYKPEKGRYLHPDLDRPITHREAARLQSFPDTFVFEGSKVCVARQIGNAVPPALAQAVAAHVRAALV